MCYYVKETVLWFTSWSSHVVFRWMKLRTSSITCFWQNESSSNTALQCEMFRFFYTSFQASGSNVTSLENIQCLNGSGCWWWCNGVGDIFFAHFGPLSTNWALFKHHSLPEYCCWPCPSLYDYSVPSSDANSSRIMHHVTKLKSSQTGFLNMTMSSLYSNGLHSHQISIQ